MKVLTRASVKPRASHNYQSVSTCQYQSFE